MLTQLKMEEQDDKAHSMVPGQGRLIHLLLSKDADVNVSDGQGKSVSG